MLGGFDLIVSRTGYTGEKFSYEIFVHPSRADDLFNAILEVGKCVWDKAMRIGCTRFSCEQKQDYPFMVMKWVEN